MRCWGPGSNNWEPRGTQRLEWRRCRAGSAPKGSFYNHFRSKEALAVGVSPDAGIGSWVTRRAFLSGDRVALIDGDRRITYTEFDRRTDQLARALRDFGVRQGDRVAALLVNSSAFLETMFATAKLGAVFVPINFRLAPSEVTYLLADFGADVFVWSGHLSPHARALGVEVEIGQARPHLAQAPVDPTGGLTKGANSPRCNSR